MSKKLNGFMSFAVSFLVAGAVAWLGVNHMKHTIFEQFAATSNVSENISVDNSDDSVAFANAARVASEEYNDGGGCGCPACCAVQSL